MNVFYFSEILKFAIEREKQSYELYGKMAIKVTDAGVQKIFLELQKQERNHRAFYEGILEIVENKQSPAVQENEEYYAYLRELIDSARTVKSLSDADMDDIHAVLDFAIAREKDSVLFYAGLRNYIIGPMRDKIDVVISEEEKHVAILLDVKAKYPRK